MRFFSRYKILTSYPLDGIRNSHKSCFDMFTVESEGQIFFFMKLKSEK